MKDSLKEIINIAGKDHIILPTELDLYSVDGKKPNIVVFPRTIEEISEIMKVASRESLGVIPWGRGTKIGFGREPHKVDIVLCTERLNRILEYEASDLVGTAECGISLKELQRVLKEKKQFLSIDPPHVQNGATLGGIIATNDSGPRRLKFGTMRESLIGIKVVRPDGSVIKGGAKVVKNVAGYDLPKLYVGSLGTLGIIVEGTFRLYPIPETSETLLFSFPTLQAIQETVLSVLNSSLVPSCLEILNLPLINAISDKLNLNFKKEKYALAVRIEGVEKAVRDQISKMKDICRERGGEGILIESNLEENLWEEIRGFPWRIAVVQPGSVLSSVPQFNRGIVELSKGSLQGENRVICKASVLITDVSRVLRASEELSKNSGVMIYISVRAGNGVLIISIEGEILSVIESTKSLRDLVSALKGALVIQGAPLSLKSQVDVWGDVGSSLNVMKKLKTLFDPYCILNPGRFVDDK